MILDATCGAKGIYHGLHKNLNKDDIVFMDVRKGKFENTNINPELSWARGCDIEPDVIGSVSSIPLEDNQFTLVIFDPPWIDFHDSSMMRVRYGSWNREEAIRNIYRANKEFHRVLVPGGILLVKYQKLKKNNVSLEGMINLFSNFKLFLKWDRESLGDTKGADNQANKVYWLLFIAKRESELV